MSFLWRDVTITVTLLAAVATSWDSHHCKAGLTFLMFSMFNQARSSSSLSSESDQILDYLKMSLWWNFREEMARCWEMELGSAFLFFFSGISEIGVTRYSHRATVTLLRTISSDHEHILSNLKCSMKFDVMCICEMCKCWWEWETSCYIIYATNKKHLIIIYGVHHKFSELLILLKNKKNASL